MAQSFNQSSHSEPHRIKRVPGSPDSLKLLDDSLLEDMLGRLESLPMEACYPLQLAFYEKMLHCDLLLPVPVGTQLQKGLPILTLENSRREKGLPLFTSEKSLGLWAEEATDYVLLPFSTLCGYAMEAKVDYLIINIAGPYGCEISFYDFSYLAEGLLPPPSTEQSEDTGRKAGEIVVEKETPMHLGVCSGLSSGITERLNHLFQYHRHLISHVYLFEIAFNQGPLQPALGIRMPDNCEDEWEKELWPNLQAILQEMLEKRTVINVFLLNQAGSMEQHVQKLSAPIFTNKSAD